MDISTLEKIYTMTVNGSTFHIHKADDTCYYVVVIGEDGLLDDQPVACKTRLHAFEMIRYYVNLEITEAIDASYALV